MELGRWLKHAYAIAIVLLLHISASLSLGHVHHANMSKRCLEKERDALLAIKAALVDDYKKLSSWGSQDCCEWERVQCDHQTGHVIQLLLGGYEAEGEYMEPIAKGGISIIVDRGYSEYFKGEISPKIIELQYLKYLDLSLNYFNATQIPALICSLSSLTHLDLHSNSLTGSKIPELVGNLTNLRYLDLSNNQLGGEIPYLQLKNLTHLQNLNLGDNYFTLGVGILDWLSHHSSLNCLDLSTTDLSKASDWLGTINKLSNLKNLTLRECNLPPPILSTLSHINSSNPLVSVDLSENPIVSGSIFKWLSNYNTTLTYLDLSSNQLIGLIPHVLRSMSSLEQLHLSSNQFSGLDPNTFANMSSLTVHDLSNNPLEQEIPTSIAQLCKLQYLFVSGCNLTGQLSELVQRSCSENSLKKLHLSDNHLTGPFPNLTNFSWLEELYLSGNKLSGRIPDSIGNLSSLKYLYVVENQLSQLIPESIGELSRLYALDLSGNFLSGKIPESIGQLSRLGYLDLSVNQISGSIPESIGQMSSTMILDLSTNRLRGRVPQRIGQLSMLSLANLSMNHLEGEISETHFSKLNQLISLDLSLQTKNSSDLSKNSFLELVVASDWVPPFQLSDLKLRSCKLGPNFPNWLRTQVRLTNLDISDAGISDVIPNWFWGLFDDTSTFDLSNNQIRGTLGSSEATSFLGVEVRLSSNQLEGSVPSFLSTAPYLDLSDNKFSNVTSLLCSSSVKVSKFLNLSNNHISGEVPDCWRYWVNLEFLDLSNNFLSGKISPSIGDLDRIKTLKLRNNRLLGELPSSLKYSASLNVIDLGNNTLSSSVPQWIGVSLPNLVILMLQSNQFSGSLPSQLCHLAQLRILDVSANQISGSIPKCLNNLTSLATKENSNLTIRHPFSTSEAQPPMTSESTLYYEDVETFMWKGRYFSYQSILGLVKSIDLSSNKLTGEIPSEITHLLGLVSLNLSRNQLTGQIPPEIEKLESLDSLDLSRNKIHGGIPESLAHIYGLGVMDLSYNNLSGEIPSGTQLQSFDASSYIGNPLLCGPPLDVCNPEGTGPPNGSSAQEDADELITQDFYISLGLGFAVGFWGVCGSLIFKRSWRYAYYNFLNALNDWLYVRAALIRRKIKDKLNRQS